MFPHNHYWRRDDGKFFSSARSILVDETDPDLIAWFDAGNRTTRWPVDDNNEQTDEALQEVLMPYNIYVTLDHLKTGLKAQIDAQAEQERLKYITPGAGQAMTYSRKVEQARAVLAASNPVPEDYPMLATSIGIDGEDLISVANVIIGMNAAWETIGSAIELARLSAKRAIDQAETVEDAKAVTVTWPNL